LICYSEPSQEPKLVDIIWDYKILRFTQNDRVVFDGFLRDPHHYYSRQLCPIFGILKRLLKKITTPFIPSGQPRKPRVL